MTDLFTIYDATRTRMLALADEVGPDALAVTVPSCPDWSAQQLLAHCVSLPAAIGAGDLPTGDLDEWIAGLVASRSGRTTADLAAEWATTDPTIIGMLGGGGGAVLFDDLVVHEHDLRGALDRPDHDAFDADVTIPRSLDALRSRLDDRGLAPIEVRSPNGSWSSHDGEPGWVLATSPWEAMRALSSRRTADELRALGASDDYCAVVDDHLPLPGTSLGER